ncbi:OmpA family protein [Salinisphaera shabanensis E1L3A]|uniref:OmpA family protein n=1 Tax=Salinisphaera shabanensis E1L3A TaxID=1033802 RepID=U2FZI3_9GAMM|nr:OmpA family protein [Salinisphaera shabanensis]ERJ19508.1 OmpA family protein [Salinisphaera shabanensis E1L3A]
MIISSLRSFSLLYLFAAMVATSALAQETPPTPAVAAPATARMVASERQDFATYPLIVDRIAQRGGINGNISATRTVEGALTRITYELADNAQIDEAATEYAQRLGRAGFDIVYECEASDCGPTFVRASPGYRLDAERFRTSDDNQRYLAARKADSGGDIYVGVQIAAGRTGVAVQVDTLRVKPREIGAISVNAAQMANDLDTQGRVALYGIFFNTDSTEVKPESRPTLSEIAKLMAERPSLKLLVVGHTDSRGTFDYNIDLSQRRAEAVVGALATRYGVQRNRLKPWGVGYAVPRASNNSDVGKSQNRRVELVVW